MSSCDFFVWGYMQGQVNRELHKSITVLKASIRHATVSITEEVVQKVIKTLKADFVGILPKWSSFLKSTNLVQTYDNTL